MSSSDKVIDIMDLYPLKYHEIVLIRDNKARKLGRACMLGDEKNFRTLYPLVRKEYLSVIDPVSIFIKGDYLSLLKVYYNEFMTPREKAQFCRRVDVKSSTAYQRKWHILKWMLGLGAGIKSTNMERARKETYQLLEDVITFLPNDKEIECGGEKIKRAEFVEELMLWVQGRLSVNSENEWHREVNAKRRPNYLMDGERGFTRKRRKV